MVVKPVAAHGEALSFNGKSREARFNLEWDTSSAEVNLAAERSLNNAARIDRFRGRPTQRWNSSP